MAALRTINVILAFIATTAPLAHVLELPSKLTLDGPLWLAVQQHLYRGWGAVFGPVEIAVLASTGVLLALTWPTGARRTYFLAFACYASMIAVFFLFNAPVNEDLERLDTRNITDQLEHLSAALGDRPRVRGCSGRHCLCRADAAVEGRADEMNACSDCFW
jgi:hypothetical protein